MSKQTVTTWVCDGCGATETCDRVPEGWLVVEVVPARRSGFSLWGAWGEAPSIRLDICGAECAWAGKALNEKLAEYDPVAGEERWSL